MLTREDIISMGALHVQSNTFRGTLFTSQLSEDQHLTLVMTTSITKKKKNPPAFGNMNEGRKTQKKDLWSLLVDTIVLLHCEW